MSLSALRPEEKVNLAIGMTYVCLRVCAGAIRDQHPTIKEEELLELMRERIMFSRSAYRLVKEVEDFENTHRTSK